MTVSQWEQDRRVPRFGKLELLSDVCDVPLSFFSKDFVDAEPVAVPARKRVRRAPQVSDVA